MSSDMQLRDNNILMYLYYQEWDTNFFNKPCYHLMPHLSHLEPSEKLCHQINATLSNAFITAKIDTASDYLFADFLQECNFKYIDTEIQLELLRPVLVNSNEEIELNELALNEGLPYELLGRTFSHTRFHTDPHISNDKADDLWVQYLKNFKPDKNRKMYVAKDKGEIVGTILATINNNVATLFFVAVIPSYQSQGIGKKLIYKAIDNLKGYTIRTETQVKNIQALNFYLRSGFTVKKTFSVFHRWRNG
jgi:ribosomal protein S18 acetylase RimI-like enzyme